MIDGFPNLVSVIFPPKSRDPVIFNFFGLLTSNRFFFFQLIIIHIEVRSTQMSKKFKISSSQELKVKKIFGETAANISPKNETSETECWEKMSKFWFVVPDSDNLFTQPGRSFLANFISLKIY